jgi:cytochrome c-type biogenesis protein CcmH
MTQGGKGTLPAGKIALAVAATILAFAVAHSIWKDRARAPDPAPAAASTHSNPQSIEALAAFARAHPQDVAAWTALGTATFEEGRFEDASDAYDKAIRIRPATAALWSALGEARVMASKRDPLPAEAVAAFQKAVSLDPKDARARYFLAVKKDIAGNHAGAIDDWLQLLAETPGDAPWRRDLVRTIEQVGKINRIDVAARIAAAEIRSPAPPLAARAIPGPSAQDLQAAAAIPPGEQRAMAEAMVARLETRLKSGPANVDGWIKLMRSRMTLGQRDKAAAALRDAVAANPGKAELLRQQADVLGVR